MAITWGPTRSSSGGTVLQLGIEFATSTYDTYQKVTARAYLRCTAGSVGDNLNSLSFSGGISGTISNVSASLRAGQSIQLGSVSKNVTRQYGSATSTSVTATLSGIELIGSALTASASNSTPARAYAKPTPPSFSSLSFSGGNVAVSWVNKASTSAPYTKLELSRSINGGTWAVVSTWASSPTSYADSIVASNSSFQYRLRAYNSSGWGSYAYSGTAYSNPAAPTGVSATRSGGNVILTFANGARFSPSYTVEYQLNGGSWTSLATGSASTSHTLAVSTSDNVRFRVLADINGASSSWVSSNTVYSTPSAVASATAYSLTATSQRVTWTPGASNGDPSLTYRVEVSENGGTFKTAYEGTATTRDFSGLPAGRTSVYRVYAVSSGGSSAPTSTATLYTTPLAPTGLSAVKDGTEVTLSWTGAPYGSYSVQRQYGSGAWVEVTTTGATSYSDAPDPSQPVTYRVQTYKNTDTSTGVMTLRSGYVTSQQIQLLAPPLAPRVVPTASVFDPDKTTPTVRIEHNPVDSSSMTSVEVRMRYLGQSDYYYEYETFTGSGMAITVAPHLLIDPGATFEVQARTKGAHYAYGPWSSTTLVYTSTTPVGGFSAPAATLDTSSMTVVATFSDVDSTLRNWDLDITKDGEPFYTRRALTSLTHKVPLVIPEGQYRLTGRVQDSAGLWSSPFTRDVTVTYAKPSSPLVVSEWDEDGGVTLNFDAGRTALVEARRAELTRLSESIWRDPEFEGGEGPNGDMLGTLYPIELVPSPFDDGEGTVLSISSTGMGTNVFGSYWSTEVIPGHTYLARYRFKTDSTNTGFSSVVADWLPETGAWGSASSSFYDRRPGPVSETIELRITPSTNYVRTWMGLSTQSNGKDNTEGRVYVAEAALFDITDLLPLENSLGTVDATSVTITKGDRLLAEGLPVVSSYRDPIPALPGETYTVSAVSDIPSSASTEHNTGPYNRERKWVFFNGGNNFTGVAKLRIDPTVSVTPVVDKELVEFDGRRAPLEFSGSQNYRVAKVSGRVSSNGERLARLADWRPWEEAAAWPAPVCFRDWLGRRLFGSLQVDGLNFADSPHAAISATLTEVDYEE